MRKLQVHSPRGWPAWQVPAPRRSRPTIMTTASRKSPHGSKGKKVAFVPLSMGFDLTEGWNAGLQNQG